MSTRISRWTRPTSSPRLPEPRRLAQTEDTLPQDPVERILGVDPGSTRTGWALLTGSLVRPVLIACGTIRLPAGAPFAEKLCELHRALSEIVARFGPTTAAVETPFHGINAHSAFQLAHARGVVLAVLGAARVPVAEYAPSVIKKAVTGNGRAEKAQVQQMVGALLRLRQLPDSEDASDAAGVAYCHAATQGVNHRIRQAVLAGKTGTGRPAS